MLPRSPLRKKNFLSDTDDNWTFCGWSAASDSLLFWNWLFPHSLWFEIAFIVVHILSESVTVLSYLFNWLYCYLLLGIFTFYISHLHFFRFVIPWRAVKRQVASKLPKTLEEEETYCAVSYVVKLPVWGCRLLGCRLVVSREDNSKIQRKYLDCIGVFVDRSPHKYIWI